VEFDTTVFTRRACSRGGELHHRDPEAAAQINPDALAKMDNFKMPKITAIGDSGVIKDSS